MPEEKHKFDEKIESRLASIVLDSEYQTAMGNSNLDFEDFQAHVDLFDGERSEREYEWMSNIRLPEFASHILTQASNDVAQYFRTRDYVETYVMNKSDAAVAAAAAAGECINTTLNRRDLYYYLKYLRAKHITYMNKGCWAECRWEQDLTVETTEGGFNEETGEEIAPEETYDINKDHFNFDIIDPRNVFVVDTKYTYSAQQKDAIIIRSETSYEKLVEEQDRNGYFNLDLVKDLKTGPDTETKRGTTDQDGSKNRAENKVDKPLDKFKRYGTFWYKDGKPGIDDTGEKLDDATLEECVMIFVQSGSTRILIAFHLQPYKDSRGRRYKPLIRGLEYVHPTDDNGSCDAEFARPLQIGIDDTFNMGNDRTRLATIPTMKGKRYVVEDEDIHIEPGWVNKLEAPEDLMEMKIEDNIQGALAQMGILTDKMRIVTATQPPDMGSVPELSSTTATAVANASQGSSQRNNYKSMTFENTFLSDLYWMIIQMTWQFAKPETGFNLMGDKVYDFNPEYDFFYTPLSQSIETDQSKGLKIQRWTQILTAILQTGHPDAVKLVNYIMVQIATLMGDEFENFADKLLNPQIPIDQGGQAAGGQGFDVGAASNQNVIPMSISEVSTRQAANV
ncbi:MAG: hypothetical protein ACYS17_12855 [Planctomycetota bacterium]|jgi:hypothetical protein